MKKFLWMFIAVAFLFTACEKEETMVNPESEAGFQKDACIISTKMIAGGGKYDEKCSGEHVGNITVEEDADGNVIVTYEITVSPWKIDATHLYIGEEDGIPSGKKGNPKIGNFPYKMEHDPGVTTYTYSIPAEDVPEDYVIAAHADVSIDPLDCFSKSLPATATVSLTHPGAASYFDIQLSNAGDFNGTYAAWCIDVGHSIASNDGTEYTVDIFSTYGGLVDFLSEGDDPNIDFPEKLPIINWIINQGFVGTASVCGGNFTMGDVQRAIWEIIDVTPDVEYGLGAWSECRVAEILAAVEAAGTEASEFVPLAGGFGAAAFVPEGNAQVMAVTFSFDCEAADETAWGFGYCADCESVGDCHDGETGVADGISFTESTEYYGGSAWGWYFYGCDFPN
ncbi:MAG: hypothetical protein P8100_11240 [bacterium]